MVLGCPWDCCGTCFNSKEESGYPKRAGYDFDGVFHSDVTQMNESGQRSPAHYLAQDEYSFVVSRPIKKIFERIRDQVAHGTEIFIITHRHGRDNTARLASSSFEELGYRFLKEHHLDDIIPTKNCYVAHRSKVDVIRDLDLDEYSDDSLRNLLELQQAIKNGAITHPLSLFLVYPEYANTDKPCIERL